MADETPPVASNETAAASVVAVEPTALGPEIKKPEPEIKVEAPVEISDGEKPAEIKEPELKLEEKPAEVKVEQKPAEEKPAEIKSEEKPVEVKPVEIPKFEVLTLPEGVKLEDAQIKEIDSMFGNFEITSKAPHAEIQKLRQGMVEYGLGVIKDRISQVQKQANEYWESKVREYRKAFESDPEIGGPKKDATTEAARQFIAQHAGSPERAEEVRKILYDHKLADHPAIIRLLANANLERSEGKPLPAQKAVPMKQGKLDRWYGNMKE